MSWLDCSLVGEFVEWLNDRFNMEDKEFPLDYEIIEQLKVWDDINGHPFSQKVDFRTNFAKDLLNAIEIDIEKKYMED